MFDEGPTNKVASGHLPPAYPLNQIKTPLVLFEGTADSLQDPGLQQLPSLVGKHDIEGYEHLDFMWAESVGEKVWPQLIEHLNRLRNPVGKAPLSPPAELSKSDLMKAFEEFLDERRSVKTRNLEYHFHSNHIRM